MIPTLYWQNNRLYLLDQRQLPFRETYLACSHWQEVRDAIQCLAVRGAPAIGVAAAYAVVLAAQDVLPDASLSDKIGALKEICRQLDAARPTAVNLHWALTQMWQAVKEHQQAEPLALLRYLTEKAAALQEEDVRINTAMAEFGAAELAKAGHPLVLLTHCNAGALATAGVGTALGVIRALHKKGLVRRVYADETRPLLQGARLTAYELLKDQIPVTLITDNMAAWTMRVQHVEAIIVGADRIARNGDTANKIGTYGLSLLARQLHIPLYIAAPSSTFDLRLDSGADIPIEEREAAEVRTFQGNPAALPETPVFNPAFDVTPHENIYAIITEKGLIYHPDTASVCSFFQQHF